MRILRQLIYITLLFSTSGIELAASQTKNKLAVSAPTKEIIILLSEDRPIYQSVVTAAEGHIQSQEFAQLFTIKKFLIESWQTYSTTLSQTKPAPVRLLISVGTKACQFLLSEVDYTFNQRLCTFIPKQTFSALQLSSKYSVKVDNVSAIYIDQPISRQVALVRHLIPQKKQIGLIISGTKYEIAKRYMAVTKYNGITLDIHYYKDGDNIKKEIESLLLRNDAILALPDPQVHSPTLAKWLLYNAYKMKRPVIAFSQSYVRAGALGAIYSTPAQIGKQTGEYIISWLTNIETHDSQLMSPKYFDIAINKSVAASLRLPVPDVSAIKILLRTDKFELSAEMMNGQKQ